MSASSKQKARTRQRRRGRKSKTLRLNTSGMTGAPVGVSQDLQQFTRFYPGSARENLRMHVCAAISEISRISSTTSGSALVDPAGNQSLSMQMNLTEPAGLITAGTKFNSEWTSPVFDLIASAFVRYRVRKLIFHYEPQAAATTTERLVFAFAEDPMHPALWNATIPTQSSLLALSDSIAFAPWRGWSMDVTESLGDTLMYTFTDPSTTVASFAERFSDFGVMSCITSSVSGTLSKCGILYAEMEIELEEFCPISLTAPSSAKRLRAKLEGVESKGGYSVPEMAKAVSEDQGAYKHCTTSELLELVRAAFPKHSILSFAEECQDDDRLRRSLTAVLQTVCGSQQTLN